MSAVAEIGEALRSLRETKGLRQTEVASTLGVSHQLVSCIEHGTRDPRLSTLYRVLALYGLSVGGMFTDPRLIAVGRKLDAMPPDDREQLMQHIEWAADEWMREDTDDAEAMAPRPALPPAPVAVCVEDAAV